MSKNKYSLPFQGKWYVEFGGLKQEDWHDPYNVNQRYAYDLEIRVDHSPFHDNHTILENFYSYNQDVLAPCDGIVVDIQNIYDNTHINKNRDIICDCDDVRGNYIVLKHKYNEYSYIEHFQKDSFQVTFGDQVTRGQVLGKVGNSGNSNGPHIHFHIQDRLDYYNGIGIPITFKQIRVFNKNNKRLYFKSHIRNTQTVENIK